MEQYRPGEHIPSEVHRCDLGQNPELQIAPTQNKDEGGHPKQPPEVCLQANLMNSKKTVSKTKKLNFKKFHAGI